MSHRVTLIPGDGIGPEVTVAAQRVIDAAGVSIEWDRQEAGRAAFEDSGTPVPDVLIESIEERGVALKGPLDGSRPEYRSPSIAIRAALDAFVTIRPCRALAGAPTRWPATDLVLVKMNHEDLYAGIGYGRGSPGAADMRALIRGADGRDLPEDAGISIKPISASESARAVDQAFRYAREHGRESVTVVHKANLMPETDGLFLSVAREVAARYPELELRDALIDAVCEQLVTRPDSFDVLVTPRMYGDLLSGIGAALIGGVGLAPGVNLAERCVVFEAAHGPALRQAGRDRANPMAAILCGAMLLRHLGEVAAADRVVAAVETVLTEGQAVTYDMRPSRDASGAASTSEAADAVIAALREAS